MTNSTQCFNSYSEWVSFASRWLTSHEKYGQFFRSICFDKNGMICLNGGDFQKAQYPVYWIWPDQNLFTFIDSIDREKT